jgi:hypothetical protein
MLLVLLVGLGMLLGSLLTYALVNNLLVHTVVRLARGGYTEPAFWKNLAVMMIVTLLTAAAHLIQIALWALIFLLSGQLRTMEDAFYFSAVNYTSLGYGDIVLTGPWRLLGPLEAMNGLLLFGLSTALMFAVLSRMIANRLHGQLGPAGFAGPTE